MVNYELNFRPQHPFPLISMPFEARSATPIRTQQSCQRVFDFKPISRKKK